MHCRPEIVQPSWFIGVEFQCGLGNVGAGVAGRDRRQIELNVSGLRGALDIGQGLRAIVGSRIGGVSVGISAERKLPVGRRARQTGSETEVKSSAAEFSGFS
jgi:hypothetical protein